MLRHLSLLSLAAAAAPAVYWRASPVAANQTALFAGAGFGAAPRAFACTDGAACRTPLELPLAHASWESSLFFAYPAACALAPQPACAFALCAGGASPPRAVPRRE